MLFGKWEKNNEERANQFNNDFLFIPGGSYARIWILRDEVPDIFEGTFHSFRKTSGRGIFFERIYCPSEEGEECEHCVNPDEESIRVPMYFFWIYLDYIIHSSERRFIQTQKVEEGFKETVEKLKILRFGRGQSGYIVSKFRNYYKRYKTLCDRPYEWSRTGKGTETAYDLMACDIEVAPSKFESILEGQSNIADIAKGVAHIATISKEVKSEETKPRRSLLNRMKKMEETDQKNLEDLL